MMQNQNKLSFIPHAGETNRPYKQPGSMFFKFSVLFLMLSVLFLASVFIYKRIISQRIEELVVSIERAKKSFDEGLISEMNNLSQNVAVADELLGQHLFSTKIFSFLEKTTLEQVRFTNFQYIFEKPRENVAARVLGTGQTYGVSVSLNGEAKNYLTLAQQSEVFKNSEEIKSFVFSDFVLTQDGNVSFKLGISFNPKLIWEEE